MRMEKLESGVLPSAPAAAEPVPELADEPGGDRVDNDDRDTAGENTEEM